MERFRIDGVILDRCLGCAGQWFDPGAVKVVPATEVGSPLPVPQRASGNWLSPLTSRVCPRCVRNLLRAHLGSEQLITIEACDQCRGFWLDSEQLDRLRGYRDIEATAREVERPTTWLEWWFQFLLGLPVEFGPRAENAPWVTRLLILINVLMFLPFYFGYWRLFPQGRMLGLVPNDLLTGANPSGLFTYMFVHIEFWHLLGNLYFLHILGRKVEDVLGRGKTVLLYIASGIVGGLFHSLWTQNPGVPMFGASAGVSGVMAAYMVLFNGSRLSFMFIFIQRKMSSIAFVWLWILIQVAYVKLGVQGVAWIAHIAGFFAGLFLVRPLRDSLVETRPILALLNSANFRDISSGPAR